VGTSLFPPETARAYHEPMMGRLSHCALRATRDTPRGRSRLGARFAVIAAGLALLGAGCAAEPALPPPGGVYRSDDGGITFVQKVLVTTGRTLARAEFRQGEIVPRVPGTLFAVTDEGLYVTRDAGNSWSRTSLPASSVFTVSVHPRNPQILLAGGTGLTTRTAGSTFKSVDGGRAWTEVFQAPPAEEETGTIVRRRRSVPSVVTTIAHDPRTPEVVFAGTSTGALVVSDDGGIHWQRRASVQQGITGLKLSPTVSGRLVLRLTDGTLVRSADGGRTIDRIDVRRTGRNGQSEELPSGFGTAVDQAQAVLFAAPAGSTEPLFVGARSGLYRSDDGGVSWTQIRLPTSLQPSSPITHIAQSADGALWVAAGPVLLSSHDGGITWRSVTLPGLGLPLRFVLADPTEPKRLYLFFAR